MFSNQSVEVSLNVPLRSMDAVRGDKVESRFLVGSSSLDSNYLHLVRFHTELNQLGVEALLEHPGGIATICTSPTDNTMVLTIAEQSMTTTLWKIPREIMERTNSLGYSGDEDMDEMPPAETAALEERAILKSEGSEIVDVQWRGSVGGPHGGEEEQTSTMGDVLTLDRQGRLTQWDIAFGAAESTRHCNSDVLQGTWNLPPHMAWDPHHADSTAVAAGTHVQLIDWRTSPGSAGMVERFPCHRYGVTDLDYNPNKPHVLTTAGQEGFLKFWDLRNVKQPLLTVRGGHSHWATCVSYNPFHDQLVMSAGSDSIVNLWRISTISSAPLLTLDDEDDDDDGGDDVDNNEEKNTHRKDQVGGSNANGPNVLVSRQEHMDSVYATAWGAADAWIYASAGYDGKVVLSHVPSKEKYKILL